MSNTDSESERHGGVVGQCSECGFTDKLTSQGRCGTCTQPSDKASDAIRHTLEKLSDEHELPELFWSLNRVYDEYDQKMTESDY